MKLSPSTFLICFPMKYRDFSVKINSENNSENTIFIFTVCKKRFFFFFFFFLFMNFRLKVLPKRFKMWYACLKLRRGR